MSESKSTCPLCGRPPGGVHAATCERGTMRQNALLAGRKIAKAAAMADFIWISSELVCLNPNAPPELRKYRKEVRGGTRREGQRHSPEGVGLFTSKLRGMIRAALNRKKETPE